MRILFWNLKNNSNEKWLSELIREKNVDIAIFAEYQNTSFDEVIAKLDYNYIHHEGYGACDKVTLLCKNNIDITINREQSRYTLYSCVANRHLYNIIGIHLPSPPSSDSNDRKNTIRDIVQDINEQENRAKNRMTIVIGDFNCNPFDEEIIQKDSFNAVLFKSLIVQQETIKYHDKMWRRFYNPIIHFLSEETKTYGSLYYSSGSSPLYWNSFDQILVRKELIDCISSLQYIKEINGKELIRNVKPIASISDHLPLLVDILEQATNALNTPAGEGNTILY